MDATGVRAGRAGVFVGRGERPVPLHDRSGSGRELRPPVLPQDVPVWQWLPSAVGGLVMLPAAWLAWRAPTEGGRRLAAFFLAVSVWCLTAAAGNLGSELTTQVRWARAGYLGIAFATPTWALFACRFSGVRLPPWLEGLVLLPAAVTLLLAWSEAGVRWIWSEVYLDPTVPYVDAVFVHGPWFERVFVPYGVAMVVLGAGVLAWRWLRGGEAQAWRYLALIAVSAVPITANLGYLSRRGEGAGFDPTPVALALAGMVMTWLLVDRRLFDTLPLAHRLVFDSRPDADMVLDRLGAILDMNPAAERLLGLPLRRARGRPLARVAPHLAAASRRGADAEVHDPDTGRVFRVDRRPIRRGGEELWAIEDVTDEVRERETLQRRGLLLEAVDALLAGRAGEGAGDPLHDTLARIGRALDLEAVRVIVDEGEGEAFTVRAAWRREGAAQEGRNAYEDAGLIPVRDAIRLGRTTVVGAGGPASARQAVTLRVSGEAWGALVLEGGDPARVAAMRDALEGVARSLAGWLEHEVAERERRRGERFRAGLLELTRALLLGDVGSDPYRLALRHAMRAIPGAEAGALFVRRDGSDHYACVAALGPVAEAKGTRSGAALGLSADGMVRALSDGEAARVAPGARAVLVAPVTLAERTEAVLRLENRSRSDAFGAREVAMGEAFAAQLGAALKRLEMQAASERAAQAQHLLADVERLLLSSDELDAFVPVVARRVLDAGLWPLSHVVALELRHDGTLDPRVHGPGGRDAVLEAQARTTPLRADALRGTLAEEGPTVTKGSDVGPPGMPAIAGAEAVATFPLRLDGRPWGAIAWVASREDAFEGSTLEWLTQVASALELALLRQRDRRHTERQLARLRALVDTGEALRTYTRRTEVVQRVLLTLLDTTEADHCALLLRDDAGGGLRVAGTVHRHGREDRPEVLVPRGQGLPWRVLEEDGTVVLADVEGLDGAHGFPHVRPTAWMGTPVRNWEGESVGVLEASHARRGGTFERDEVGMLEALAQAAGTTLVRLALLERSRRQTREYRELWEEARRGEERFRLLAENMSDTVCLHDGRGRYLYVSPSVEALLGYPPHALLGRGPQELVHGEDVESFREGLIRPLARGTPVRGVTFRMRHVEGYFVWLETSAQPIEGERGGARRYVSTSRDVTERKRIEARLVHGALYDDLTGLPNRALLMDRLRHAQDRARRQGGRFAVLFLDLDRFKLVNDSLGHSVGDELLTAVATRLSACVRDADTVARLSGDEFCVLLEGIEEEDTVLRTADRIQAALGQPFTLDDTDLFTSASIGIAFSHPEYAGPDELLRDADTAMYRAKADGKARHAVFDQGMHAQAMDRLAFETSLHRAIERDELTLAFQPIVRLSDAEVIGVEALVRWTHPERGEVPPAEFVAAAEESGLVLELDRWVLDRACRQLAAWEASHPETRSWTVSVNLSPRHFTLPDPAGSLLSVVDATGLDSARVRLEVTERALWEGGQAVRDALRELRLRGVAIGIDDFGTGYSSLAYLQNLPLDALKVDRSFVQGLEGPPQQRQLVSTIIALARGLGIETVAEGVEQELQLRALTGLGCTYGQGWLWSPALDASAFEGRYLDVSANGPRGMRG